MREGGQRGEEGRGEDNHHGEVILGSHLGANPLNSLNLTEVEGVSLPWFSLHVGHVHPPRSLLRVQSQLRISQTETQNRQPTSSQQAANKFPTTSVLFNVGIVEILSCNSLYVE